VESEDEASKQIKPLMQRTQQEVQDESLRRDVIELIEKIIVYKFAHKSRQELKKMFITKDWKETWKDSNLYHVLMEYAREDAKEEVKEQVKEEVKQEAKLESVPRLLKLGLTVEQIAQVLDLSIATVRQVADGN